MTYQIATCTSDGTIIEIDEEVADTMHQAQAWLSSYVKAGPNLWSSRDDDGTPVYARIVDMR